MKRRLMRSLAIAVLALSSAALADESRWDVLRVYQLAGGKGVAVAYPGKWQEVSRTRVLELGAPARFVDERGRRVEIPAAALERAAESRTIARPQETH
jgi:hypothetical protein